LARLGAARRRSCARARRHKAMEGDGAESGRVLKPELRGRLGRRDPELSCNEGQELRGSQPFAPGTVRSRQAHGARFIWIPKPSGASDAALPTRPFNTSGSDPRVKRRMAPCHRGGDALEPTSEALTAAIAARFDRDLPDGAGTGRRRWRPDELIGCVHKLDAGEPGSTRAPRGRSSYGRCMAGRVCACPARR
jgi:hypothetical protein